MNTTFKDQINAIQVARKYVDSLFCLTDGKPHDLPITDELNDAASTIAALNLNPDIFEKVKSLESQVKELREAGNALIEAMNQYSFFADGYRKGSASISEVQHANDQQNEAYSKMFDVLKSLNKQP